MTFKRPNTFSLLNVFFYPRLGFSLLYILQIKVLSFVACINISHRIHFTIVRYRLSPRYSLHNASYTSPSPRYTSAHCSYCKCTRQKKRDWRRWSYKCDNVRFNIKSQSSCSVSATAVASLHVVSVIQRWPVFL